FSDAFCESAASSVSARTLPPGATIAAALAAFATKPIPVQRNKSRRFMFVFSCSPYSCTARAIAREAAISARSALPNLISRNWLRSSRRANPPACRTGNNAPPHAELLRHRLEAYLAPFDHFIRRLVAPALRMMYRENSAQYIIAFVRTYFPIATNNGPAKGVPDAVYYARLKVDLPAID